jgi:hypothetical protein
MNHFFCLANRLVNGAAVFIVSILLTGSGCQNSRGDKEICGKNVRILLDACFGFGTEGLRLPKDFGEIKARVPNKTVFLCSLTKQPVGDWTNVHEWTDFIYVGGLTIMDDAQLPVIICRAENCGGEFGYVGFLDGSVQQRSKSEIAHLIVEPWAEVKKLDTNQKDELKRRIVVRVPGISKRL